LLGVFEPKKLLLVLLLVVLPNKALELFNIVVLIYYNAQISKLN
jgi:hypothetical protein